MANFQFMNKAGEQVSAELSVLDYKAAAANKMSLAQYLEHKHGADADTKSFGNVFSQACQSVGIYEPNKMIGLTSPSMAEVFGEMPQLAGGSIGDANSGDSTPAGRILYPEIIMNIIRENLEEDHTDVMGAFAKLVALNESIAGDLYVQPKIDVTGNEATRSQPTSQLALPPSMINITTSQVTKAIQTKSVGLMISEQALNHTSLDLVGLAVAAQTRGERIAMLYDNISNLLSGNIDNGTGALTQIKANTIDTAITAAGEMTHKGFLHILHDDVKKLSINSAIMDLDTYLAFEQRSGQPSLQNQHPNLRDNVEVNMNRMNFNLSDLNILLVDTAVLGANTALFFDSRYAIRKVTNVLAAYSAIEQFVMRRAQGLRLDYGEHCDRLYDEAFKPISLTL